MTDAPTEETETQSTTPTHWPPTACRLDQWASRGIQFSGRSKRALRRQEWLSFASGRVWWVLLQEKRQVHGGEHKSHLLLTLPCFSPLCSLSQWSWTWPALSGVKCMPANLSSPVHATRDVGFCTFLLVGGEVKTQTCTTYNQHLCFLNIFRYRIIFVKR